MGFGERRGVIWVEELGTNAVEGNESVYSTRMLIACGQAIVQVNDYSVIRGGE